MTIRTNYYKEKQLFSMLMDKNFSFEDSDVFQNIYEKLPADAERIVLDMKHTTNIDSTALGMMLLLSERVRSQVPKIEIINTNQLVKKVLDLSHFETIFKIVM